MPINWCTPMYLKINFVIITPCFNNNFLQKLVDVFWFMTFFLRVFWKTCIIALMYLKTKSFLLEWSFTSLQHNLFMLRVKTNDRMVFPVIIELNVFSIFEFNVTITEMIFCTMSCFKKLFGFLINIWSNFKTAFLYSILNFDVSFCFIIVKQRFLYTFFV